MADRPGWKAAPAGRRRVAYNQLMKTARQVTAIIEREDNSYVALCPELDIASQGDTVESARKNLVEALELFFESADPTEVARRLHGEVFVTRVEVMVG
jgi:predicted RNase H-like HicB family nuclease